MLMKMRDMMKRKNGQKGFTLVELIVVMAILAVLAAIAVPKYSGILNEAKVKADTATYDAITRTIEMSAAVGSITGDVIVTSAASTGKITAKVGANAVDLVTSSSAFQLSDNQGKNFTWTVSGTTVTAPVITKGVITSTP